MTFGRWQPGAIVSGSTSSLASQHPTSHSDAACSGGYQAARRALPPPGCVLCTAKHRTPCCLRRILMSIPALGCASRHCCAPPAQAVAAGLSHHFVRAARWQRALQTAASGAGRPHLPKSRCQSTRPCGPRQAHTTKSLLAHDSVGYRGHEVVAARVHVRWCSPGHSCAATPARSLHSC